MEYRHFVVEGDLLRELPSVDEVLRDAGVVALAQRLPRQAVARAVRAAIEERRGRILSGERPGPGQIRPDAAEIERRTLCAIRPSLRRVVNATGVVIHTNLGRAPLPVSAIEELSMWAGSYVNIEYDLERGMRGSRHDHIAGLLAEVLGAEAALVVNNNAAALLLCATALGRDREILVSRGELVEIGDGFRIPDVIRQGGAVLREVGTTNRTRLCDYELAVGDRTAMIVKVHRSNFTLEGFTEEVEVRELAQLARRANLVLLHDAGSGVIELPETLRTAPEPALGRILADGADVVTASGDKMLGGPQAGIIAGRRDIVEVLRKHPLTRAVRPCKLTIGLLHHVLTLYRDGRAGEIPVFAMLAQPPAAIRDRARRLARRLRTVLPKDEWRMEVASEDSRVGGGALPGIDLQTWVVRLGHAHLGANAIEERLRAAPVPVVARITRDEIVIDLRTVRDEELTLVVSALEAAQSL